LGRAGAAGLAVKVGRFLTAVTPEMCRAAESTGLPLLEVPPDVAYVDITHPLLGAIISRQTMQLQYSASIRSQFTRMVLEGHGLGAVAGELARLIGGQVVMLGEDDRLLASACALSGDPGEPPPPFAAGEREGMGVEDGLQVTVVPVLVKGIRYGALQTSTRQALGEMERMAVDHAVTVTALELIKGRAVQEAERRLAQDFVEDLIAGHLQERDLVQSRAAAMGIGAGKRLAVMIADIDAFADFIRRRSLNEFQAQEIKGRLFAAARHAVARLGKRAVVVSRSDSVLCFLTPDVQGEEAAGRAEITALAHEIQRQLERRAEGVTVSIGLSSFCDDLLELGNKCREARKALEVGRLAGGKGGIHHYQRLALQRLLHEMGSSNEARAFCRRVVGGVLEYDHYHGTSLMNTLQVFLEEKGVMTATAERLFIHRNTLSYRLQRLGALLDRDLADGETRFELLLALKLLPFVQPDA
jgi:purine catabolism regulator